MRTPNALIVQDDFHELDSEMRKNKHRHILKNVKIHNGIMTQAHLIAQKQTEWQKEPSAK